MARIALILPVSAVTEASNSLPSALPKRWRKPATANTRWNSSAPVPVSAAGRRADAYRQTPRRIEVHQDALVSYPGRAGAQARQLRSGYQPRQDVESGHDARGRRPAENFLGAFRGVARRFSRWFKHLRRRLLPSNWLTRIIDNHQYRSGCRIICVSDAVRHWTQKRRIRHSRAGGHLQSAGSFPLHAADARAEAAFAHRPEHRQQSCRHRHRDQQFRPQGHGDPYPFRGDASRDCVHLFIAGGRDSEPYQRLAKKSSAVAGRIHFSARWRTCPRCTGQWICSSCLRFMTPVPTRC